MIPLSHIFTSNVIIHTNLWRSRIHYNPQVQPPLSRSQTVLLRPQTHNGVALYSECAIYTPARRWHHFCQFPRKGREAHSTVKAMLFYVKTSSRATSVGELCLSKDFYEKERDDENRFFSPYLPRTRRYVCKYYSEALNDITLPAGLVSSLIVHLPTSC